MPRRRPEAWRTGYSVRESGGGLTAATVFGNEWFYNSTATTKGEGKTPDRPSTDFEDILGNVSHNDVIYCSGDIRFQGTCPDYYGVKIIGAVGGKLRHTTSSGVVVTGNGCAWREEATAGNAALLTLDKQGWEFHNLMFIPESGYGSVKLYRSATDSEDGAHAIFSGCSFFGGSQTGYGIDDDGASNHIRVENCEFRTLEYAYKQTGVGIAAPNRFAWINNFFRGNKTDIAGNFFSSEFIGNHFCTVYNGSTHPNTLNLALTADAGVATNLNHVIDNWFSDTSGNVTIAKGYKPATGDIWCNHVAGTAAFIAAVPS